MPDAFFEPDGDALVATPLTRGPWSEHAQHGGPPAALLARVIEAQLQPEFRLSRLSVDILRPVPIGRVLPRATLRSGRRVARAEALLEADGSAVMTATAVAQRVASYDMASDDGGGLDPPEDGEVDSFPLPWDEGYHTAVEWRFLRGGWAELGPSQVWGRQLVPLVAGERPSPAQRAIVVADSGNGVSMVVDFAQFSFVNSDLSVHLWRDPVGEWIGLDARTVVEPTGAGLATTVLHDRGGPVGNGNQSLLVAPL